MREVERRIQKAEADTADNPLPDLDRPVGVEGKHEATRPAARRPTATAMQLVSPRHAVM